MNKLPKIRENLVIKDLKDEVLIYDKSTNKSYCLNETAKVVFNACDGKKSFTDLRLPKDIIYLSLDELRKQHLIEDNYLSPFAGMNRREVIKKVGLSSLIALPIICILVAPTAANAASNSAATNQANGQTCTSAQSGGSSQCQSGYCVQTTDGSLRCCTARSSMAGTPAAPNDILGGPAATCNQRISDTCCSGSRANQFGQLCVCS